MTVNGGRIVVEALLAHGVDTVFCVPGESFLPVLDALHDARDAIRLIVCRHEATASHMAEAWGKLTGKPGVCLVTRGPGATQAAIGVHTAAQDSTPLVLLVGQVRSNFLGRGAWQEIDVAAVFGPLAKHAETVYQIERIPEAIARGFHLAAVDRPGPVVVALPEDVLYREGSATPLPTPRRLTTGCAVSDIARLGDELQAARRPIAIVGGSGWSRAGLEDLRSFIEAFDLPVCASFRRQDLFANRHPNYVGPLGIGVAPALARRVREADLVLAIGTRLGETTTSGYELLARGTSPGQRLVHVHGSAEELGGDRIADLAIHASPDAFATDAAQMPGQPAPVWNAWTAAARADYLATLTPLPTDAALDLGRIVAWLSERLPHDAIVTNGAGNYTSWVHRYYQYGEMRTQLAPVSGAMGYGVPAAIAAKLAHPDRIVVCFAGDGCFQMAAHELITARQYGLAIVFIVVNNGMLGSIRMHQELNFPGQVYGTDLINPDFVALAAASGLPGWRVNRTAEFAAALEDAVASSRGGVIELVVDPEQITPRTTLSQLREQGLATRARS